MVRGHSISTAIFWGSLSWVTRILVMLLSLWLGGLIQFVETLPETDAAISRTAGGVVVFTGGTNRIDEAAHLLASGQAKKMLISGVDAGTSQEDMRRQLFPKVPAQLFDCCVTLGRTAHDTFGNAKEAAAWAQNQSIDSFFLVTSNYHMPRSLYLSQQAIPGKTIIPFAVAGGKVVLDGWWRRPGTARFLVQEYSKYLIVLLRGMIRPPLTR